MQPPEFEDGMRCVFVPKSFLPSQVIPGSPIVALSPHLPPLSLFGWMSLHRFPPPTVSLPSSHSLSPFIPQHIPHKLAVSADKILHFEQSGVTKITKTKTPMFKKGVALSRLSMKISFGFQRWHRRREEGKEEVNSGNCAVFIMLYYGFLSYVRRGQGSFVYASGFILHSRGRGGEMEAERTLLGGAV